ncbi:membrane-bound ClpP family serine protease [Alkaliphilus hydrothermalis]|uniref:Membrane-bound ClpP family serine protease n=1 Tax=Alkaliphilus hydrothermalis TaxID=1482730 RepID=A0ABS2NTN1_9FIRM|nr:membrane-bound ClpP family serine protease [Alkaliphilus hydrothermalis]
MFYIGLLLMIIGAIMVYGNEKLPIKGGGLIIAIIGIMLLLFNEFPNELEFLKIINLKYFRRD